MAERYRFNENGWMYASTNIDGYDIDASGAQLHNGSVVHIFVDTNYRDDWGTQEQYTNNRQGAQSDTGFNEEWSMRVFELTNQERVKAGLPEFVFNDEIFEACKVRAEELVSWIDPNHTRPDGRPYYTALIEAGVSCWAFGENTAMGQSSPETVVQSWMNSPSHKANILDKDYTDFAVGCYLNNGRAYWVQLFAGT